MVESYVEFILVTYTYNGLWLNSICCKMLYESYYNTRMFNYFTKIFKEKNIRISTHNFKSSQRIL